MPYFYSTTSQQNTNGTANTDTFLAELHTVAASARAYIQKLIAGTYTAPADNQVRLRIHRLATAGTFAGGTAIVPAPVADAPAANVVASTLPTLGTGTIGAVPLVQLAYNQRGTAMWAAFNADEALGMVGANFAGVNSTLLLDSQASAVTVPVAFEIIHSE